MPFIANQEDEDKKQQQGEQQGSATVLSSPSASMNANSNAPKQEKSSSGVFTNLNQYLNANKGAAAGMGKKVESTVQEKQKPAVEAGETFKTNTDKTIDDSMITDTKGTGEALASGNYANVNSDDVNRLWSGSWKGPSKVEDAEGYYDLENTWKAAADYGDLANQGMEGTQTLTRDAFKNQGSNYSRGENMLDSWILGGSGEMQRIGDKYGKASTDTLFGGIKNYINDRANTAKTTTEANLDTFKKQVGTAVDRENATANNLTQSANNINAYAQGKLNNLSDYLGRSYLGVDSALSNAIANGFIDPKAIAQTPDMLRSLDAADIGSRELAGFTQLRNLLSGTSASGNLANIGQADWNNESLFNNEKALSLFNDGVTRNANYTKATSDTRQLPPEQKETLKQQLLSMGIPGIDEHWAGRYVDSGLLKNYVVKDPDSQFGWRFDAAKADKDFESNFR